MTDEQIDDALAEQMESIESETEHLIEKLAQLLDDEDSSPHALAMSTTVLLLSYARATKDVTPLLSVVNTIRANAELLRELAEDDDDELDDIFSVRMQ